MVKMKIGDKVTWTSQAGGYEKRKTGQVIAIVPARKCARFVARDNGYDWPEVSDFGFTRNHESYLVLVGVMPGLGRSRLYWPRVSALKQVTE
jgi:hypothetical protein